MADTAPDVENISDPIERKPFAHQLKKIGIPPIIAGIAEILRRMEIKSAKFIGHRGSRSEKLGTCSKELSRFQPYPAD
jgi:hypothetical protein